MDSGYTSGSRIYRKYIRPHMDLVFFDDGRNFPSGFAARDTSTGEKEGEREKVGDRRKVFEGAR